MDEVYTPRNSGCLKCVPEGRFVEIETFRAWFRSLISFWFWCRSPVCIVILLVFDRWNFQPECWERVTRTSTAIADWRNETRQLPRAWHLTYRVGPSASCTWFFTGHKLQHDQYWFAVPGLDDVFRPGGRRMVQLLFCEAIKLLRFVLELYRWYYVGSSMRGV